MQAQAPFMMWGEVVAIGEGFRSEKTKTLWPLTVQPGDLLLYPKGAARLSYENLTVDGTWYDELVFVMERDAGLIQRGNNVYPLYDRIIGHIVEDVKTQQTSSGLILFNDDKRVTEKSTTYVRVKVDYVGFGQRADNGTAIPCTVTVGDVILADKYDAWEYELIGKDALTGHVILQEDQILAIDDDYTEPAEDEIKANKILAEHRLNLGFLTSKGKGW